MPIEVRCRRCGRLYVADRTAIVAGPAYWRLCPVCRDPTPPGGLAGGAPDPRSLPTGTVDPVPA